MWAGEGDLVRCTFEDNVFDPAAREEIEWRSDKKICSYRRCSEYPRWCLRQSRTVSKTMSANPGADCAFGELPRTVARFERLGPAMRSPKNQKTAQ
jgi:hypothetical protein